MKSPVYVPWIYSLGGKNRILNRGNIAAVAGLFFTYFYGWILVAVSSE
jgi:hypothetical protein